MFDYCHAFNRKWSAAVGVEATIASVTTDKSTYLVNQRIPDIPAYIQYSWADGRSWLRMSAIMRNIQYRDIVADCNRNKACWGIKMSGSAGIGSFLTSYYQIAYGDGITSYFQDRYNGGLDMVPKAGEAGRMDAVKSWGGYLGLQYKLSKDVYMVTTYSHVRDYAPQYDGGSVAWGEQYKYAQYALADIIWNITPEVLCGVEYIYGRRVDMDRTSPHDNRLQTMLKVCF